MVPAENVSQEPVPRTLWVSEKGSFLCSDYSVLAAFESREDAERAVKAGFGENVASMKLWPAGTGPRKISYVRAIGYVADDGRMPPMEITVLESWDPSDIPQKVSVSVERYEATPHKYAKIFVRSPEVDTAIEAIRRRAAEILAEWARG